MSFDVRVQLVDVAPRRHFTPGLVADSSAVKRQQRLELLLLAGIGLQTFALL